MKSKKNAFTLIELLAVIILIGLIAVLIVPKVTKTINESKRKISKASINGLVRVAEKYFVEQKMNGRFNGCFYDFTSNTNTCNGIEFSGEKPASGRLSIDKDGKVGIAAKFDDICYVKKYNMNTFIEINNEEIACGENTYFIPQVVTTGDGLYNAQGEEGRLVYRGANPNNYIWLDENGDGISNTDENDVETEMYRIVSYENDGTIKVVRNEKIDADMAWDATTPTSRQNTADGYYCISENGCNVWGNQTNTYYNGKSLSELNQDFFFYYYPDSNSVNFSIKPAGNYGVVAQDSTLNTKLNTEYYNTLSFKKNIETHLFNVGGIYYYSTFNNGYQGGDKGLLKEKQEEQVYTWNGKIAMINITEFVETSLSNTCTSVYSNYYYTSNNITQNPNNASQYTSKYADGEWPCALQNWNYKSDYHQWLLTVSSYNRNHVYVVGNAGYFGSGSAKTSGIGVRPAFYLKADTILSGSGTESDPYRIAEI